jgi:phosphoesterase RecJ-like protein
MKDKIKQFFKKYQQFLIVMHQKPDGDCLGASLALKLYLENKKKNVQVILVDRLPEKYKILPDAREIKEIKDFKKFFTKQKFDAFIFLDCGSCTLAGIEEECLRDYPILNIDHHPTNELFGKINYLSSESSATSEILYDLFLGWKVKIDRKMATLLFAGIFTDTGGFKHSNTTLLVLRKAADLQKRGVNVAKLTKRLFNTRSIASLKILGLALSRLNINKRYNLVYSLITQKDMEEFHVNQEDLEGVINFVSSLPKVAASLLLYEINHQVKGSLRTERDDIDVSLLAQSLGGGGHKKAAGFRLPGCLKKEKFWQIK